MLQSGNKRKDSIILVGVIIVIFPIFSVDQLTFFQELLSSLLNTLGAPAAHVVTIQRQCTSIQDFVPRYVIDRSSHVHLHLL
jgi:hypothetical protein